MKNISTLTSQTLLVVFEKILRPLVKFALARRVQVQTIIDLIKKLYVSVCIEEFSLPNKKLTDSRISILTGLQRKDIKAIRLSLGEENLPVPDINPASRLIAHWQGSQGFQDKQGKPLALSKSGESPSFDELVKLISHDIHPRTLLDELISLNHVRIEDDLIALKVEAYLPRDDDEAMLDYLANNLSDHANAAVGNVLSSPDPAPYFERSVHYNQLSAQSLKELDALSRELQQETLEKINTQALALQTKDKCEATATGRFRSGSYIYFQPNLGQSQIGSSQ